MLRPTMSTAAMLIVRKDIHMQQRAQRVCVGVVDQFVPEMDFRSHGTNSIGSPA